MNENLINFEVLNSKTIRKEPRVDEEQNLHYEIDLEI